MPTPVITTHGAEITFFYAAPGQSGMIENTLGVETTDDSDFNAGDLDNIADVWEDKIVAFQNNAVTFVGTDAKLSDGSHLVNVRSTPGGDSGGEMLPVTNAMLVRKITATPGRPGRGHLFLTGVGVGRVQPAGLFDSGYVTAVQDDLDAVVAALAGHDIRPMLFHPVGLAASPITGFQFLNLVSTQRGRLRH